MKLRRTPYDVSIRRKKRRRPPARNPNSNPYDASGKQLALNIKGTVK